MVPGADATVVGAEAVPAVLLQVVSQVSGERDDGTASAKTVESR